MAKGSVTITNIPKTTGKEATIKTREKRTPNVNDTQKDREASERKAHGAKQEH
jgi:hypothetical protein